MIMTAKQIQSLAKMANEIALNTGARIDAEGSALRTAEHIRKFWTPAMREQLTDYWRQGGEGLHTVVHAALGELSR